MNLPIQNGWILSLLLLAVSYLPMLFNKKGAKRLTTFSFISKKGKNLSLLIIILFVTMLLLPAFHKITENTVQFYIGAIVTLIGTAGVLISYLNYFATPHNQLITKGLYQLSRNPIYVSLIIMSVGIGILCTIYEMIPVLLLYVIIQHPIIREEERFCRETYGEEYAEYLKKVRRYL